MRAARIPFPYLFGLFAPRSSRAPGAAASASRVKRWAPSTSRRPATPPRKPSSTARWRCSTPSSSGRRSRDTTLPQRRIHRARWRTGASRWRDGPIHSPPAFVQPAQIQQGLDCDHRGAAGRAEDGPRARIHRRGVEAVRGCRQARSAHARLAYEQAMRDVAAKYPDDREASIFWALSLAVSALPTDKTYTNQLKAGAILEKLYPEQTESSRHHPLHHSQLRRACAGRQGQGCGRTLRGDCAVRAARAAHAVAHVHAGGRVAGVD